jgi:aryl-alcohol dehydrogenase-like predicted oxidoreductase
MEKAKAAGKIRFLGITELFGTDTGHEMLGAALEEDLFDVVMTGYNLLNPSAAKRVIPRCLEKKTGVLCMFAVRQALSRPERLRIDADRILERGQADPALVKRENTLDFLLDAGIAGSLTEAAYRFCRHTPGVGVTLTGTGNRAHLEENLAAIQGPPLPPAVLEKLEAMFGGVDCVSGQ